jgi:hypothetical protein
MSRHDRRAAKARRRRGIFTPEELAAATATLPPPDKVPPCPECGAAHKGVRADPDGKTKPVFVCKAGHEYTLED